MAAGPTDTAAPTQQFVAALQQQDEAKATACLARNVRVLWPRTTLSGRDSAATYLVKGFISDLSNLKIQLLSAGGDATMGYATGYYSYDIKPSATYPTGGSQRGSYLVLGRKEGNTWQISGAHSAEIPPQPNK